MEALWLFTPLAFGIMVVPGMDMALVLSSTLAQGRRSGLAAIAGLVTGGAVHVVLGTLGVGLLLRWPAAFNAVLLAGAAYVGWIGWSLWRSPATLGQVHAAAPLERRTTYLRALATCLLNPKAYLFMVAVFPQFLRPDGWPLPLQAAVLGAILAAAQVLVYGGVAWGASGLQATLVRRPVLQAAVVRGVAGVLMGTAAWTLLGAWRG
ncbi:MAG: LysE family translocator [Comamonadaceae bacterium]|nr:MAG: LysE family translocator [Comamonadaceae bacterium]